MEPRAGVRMDVSTLVPRRARPRGDDERLGVEVPAGKRAGTGIGLVGLAEACADVGSGRREGEREDDVIDEGAFFGMAAMLLAADDGTKLDRGAEVDSGGLMTERTASK